MRTVNSAKNMVASLIISLSTILLGFITRKVFVDSVGVEYLGLNGLLSNILGVMALLEGGFASSVVYNLYKPLAEDDRPRILALMQLYRKVYRWIALGVFICGCAIFPFVHYFIKDGQSLSYVSVAYFIFLFNSLIQYFTAYKWSIINCSQQIHKLFTVNLSYQICLSSSKILILYYTENYILYLLIESFINVLFGLATIHKANQLFPYLKTKKKYKVESDTKKNIIKNMKALFVNSIGGYFQHSTDNIVISSYVGISIVGLYSNYTLLLGVIGSFASQILNSFSESVGHLIASESKEKIYDVFKVAFFVNFIVISLVIIVMSVCFSPLITAWLGPEYNMSNTIVAIILINFFVANIRNTAYTFKIKSGLFVKDKYTPLLQGIINFGLSMWFVHLWGLAGVLAATAISILSIGFWQFPNLVYKYTLHKPLILYFKKLAVYTFVGLAALTLVNIACHYVVISNAWLRLIIYGLIAVAITLIVYFLSFGKMHEWKSLIGYIKFVLTSFFMREKKTAFSVIPTSEDK